MEAELTRLDTGQVAQGGKLFPAATDFFGAERTTVTQAVPGQITRNAATGVAEI
jgi:hypothetical protein